MVKLKKGILKKMSESKVAKFIKEFDNLYTESKETIFLSFQEGGFTLSEKKKSLMD